MSNLLKLFKFTKKYYKNILISVLAMMIQVAAGFIVPRLMIDIIDEAIPNKDYDLLFVTTAMMLGVAFIGLVAGLLNNHSSQKVAIFASADLRLSLFKKIQTLSFNNIDKFKTSRLITNATNDVVRIQQFYQMLLRIIVRSPLMIGFGLALAIQTSKQLSSVFLFSIPLLIISIIVIMFLAFPRFQKVQKTIDGLNKTVLETANAPRVIKSFVSIDHENQKFEDANELFRATNISAEKVMSFADPIIMLIMNATLAGLIFLASYFIGQGSMVEVIGGVTVPQVGILIAFNSYSMQILFGLMMFAMMMVFISRAEVSAKRIREIFDEEVDLSNKIDAITDFTIQGDIEFSHVSFGYGTDGNRCLSDISFKIKKGETIGIIGSTGSGKTSMINLIPRLYDVCEGEVLIDGYNVKDLDIERLRSQISVVTQTATVFSGSVGTNIAQGKQDASYQDFVDASNKAAASEFIEQYDDLYNHEIQQKGSNLSGGQKQRLSLARAFIRKPKILILDDSTSAVDAKSEEAILRTIKELSKNMTTLVISQKISTIKDMDKIIVLETTGTIDGFDTHENLLNTSKVYQEIASSQVGNGGDFDEIE